MIRLEHVSYSVKSGRTPVDVLNEVDVELPTRERLAVLALPGAGKTSLIRLLAGSLQPQQGVIERYARLSFPVGFGGGFRAKLSIKENIAHVARLYGADIDEVLDFVSAVTETSDLMHTKIIDIAPQTRTRVAFAVSYAIPFDTYLIDNKIGVGDELFKNRCEQMFQGRCEKAGVILTTGFSRYARRYCNRVAILNGGQITLYDDFDRGCWEFDKLAAENGPPVNVAEAV